MSKRSFLVTVEVECDLSVDEAWPDGDAPDNPTAADVINAMQKSGSMSRMLSDWGLDTDRIVTVRDGADCAEWCE